MSKPLDPMPWESEYPFVRRSWEQRDYRFRPRPEYEQDRSKYAE